MSSSPAVENTLKARLQLVYHTSDLLPPQLLRKYIAYAREYVHPNLDEAARKEIGDYYLHLRSSHNTKDSTPPITVRQLESLVRLAQARAKAELREVVTGDDARDVIELVKSTFEDVSNEKVPLELSRSSNSAGKSSRNEANKFIEILKCHSDNVSKKIFTLGELKDLANQFGIAQKHDFNNFIATLNQEGYLLNKGGSQYQLVV